jgi:hypothetical protein
MNLAYVKSKASVLLKIPQVNALRGVPMPQYSGEAAQILIARTLEEGKGCLIARVGETEGRAVVHYLRHRLGLPEDQRQPYANRLLTFLRSGAGYFPLNAEAVDRMARLYLEAIADVSVYAAWTPHDALLCPAQARRIRLIDLDPFFTHRRWTLALEGRRVCVVSPFTETIRGQYDKRERLFATPVMPAMELMLVRAPMSHCGADVTGQDWHENLQRLIDQSVAAKAEVVVIGAGAYGLPLGAALARQGAAVVVLGGATQLLFGIKGNRWENDRQYRALFNENWVRPSEMERPPRYSELEIQGGAYW